jgi:hypothetical protein
MARVTRERPGTTVRTRRTGGRLTQHYPCRTTPGNPTLHYWQVAATPGWFQCAGCGVAGACLGCLAKSGGQLPREAVGVWCVRHHEVICGKRMPLSGAASLAV